MTGRCWMCGRPRGPSADGLGSHCRRKLATHHTTARPAVWPGHTQPALEEITVTTETRPAGYHRAALVNELDGGMCDDCDSTCPRCDKARTLVDAYRREVLHEALAAVGGLVGQDPAIDNDTVMACHEQLAKLATA